MRTTNLALAAISLLTNNSEVMAAHLKSQNAQQSFNNMGDNETILSDSDDGLPSGSGSDEAGVFTPTESNYNWSPDECKEEDSP